MTAFLLYTTHVVTCLFLILVVLLQQGKGADLSVFGGGATMTAFGARGAATLLHKMTVAGFVGFIITTLVIGVLQKRSGGSSVMTAPVEEAAPATQDAEGESGGALLEDEGEGEADGVLPEAEEFDADAAEEAAAEEDGDN